MIVVEEDVTCSYSLVDGSGFGACCVLYVILVVAATVAELWRRLYMLAVCESALRMGLMLYLETSKSSGTPPDFAPYDGMDINQQSSIS